MKRLRKVLPNTQETKNYLDTLPKIYLVACWAKYGVMEFPFSGKYKKDKLSGKKVPLVYQYDDHNGLTDNYYLRQITYTTTGNIYDWTFDRDEAYRLVMLKNAPPTEWINLTTEWTEMA